MSPQRETPQNDARHDARYDDQYDAQYDAGDRYSTADEREFDEPSGPPYRAIAMVLLAAVVVAVGIGLAQLFSGDDSAPAADETSTSQDLGQDGQGEGQGQDGQGQPGEAQGEAPNGAATGDDGEAGQVPPAPGPDGAPPAPPGEAQPPADPAAGQAAGGAPDVSTVPVKVYNNSNVTGLAGRTGDTLRGAGFAVSDVTNMPSDRGVVSESAAFYGEGPGEQQAAEAVAAELGIPARPRPAGLAENTPGVIVIVTQDLAR